MHTFTPTLFLRRALLLDAVATAATGLLLALGAGLLEKLLAIPAPLSLYAGLGLLPFAALVAWLGTRPTLSRAAVWAVIACNLVWVLDSFALLLSSAITPNVWGEVFIAVQALAVAVFAELEYFGLRRSVRGLAPAV